MVREEGEGLPGAEEEVRRRHGQPQEGEAPLRPEDRHLEVDSRQLQQHAEHPGGRHLQRRQAARGWLQGVPQVLPRRSHGQVPPAARHREEREGPQGRVEGPQAHRVPARRLRLGRGGHDEYTWIYATTTTTTNNNNNDNDDNDDNDNNNNQNYNA